MMNSVSHVWQNSIFNLFIVIYSPDNINAIINNLFSPFQTSN